MIREAVVRDRLPSYRLYSRFREANLAPVILSPAPATESNDGLESASLLSALVDALPKGLLVLSTDHAIVYWNQNARRLCQKLSATQPCATGLPTVITELCEQVIDGADEQPFWTIRHPISYPSVSPRPGCIVVSTIAQARPISKHPYILITIEDRDEVLQQDMQVEQRKFHLTNREAEVWLLLKREYSYQAIADTLYISLNTVKTHVRNIHAKRHPFQSLLA